MLLGKYRVFKAFFVQQRTLVFNFTITLSVANTYSLCINNKDSKEITQVNNCSFY